MGAMYKDVDDLFCRYFSAYVSYLAHELASPKLLHYARRTQRPSSEPLDPLSRRPLCYGSATIGLKLAFELAPTRL